MSNASIDENSVKSLLAVSSADGSTVVPVLANPTTHRLKVRFGTSGSDLGPTNAKRDENDVPSLLGSNKNSPRVPVVIYADNTGRLLLDAT